MNIKGKLLFWYLIPTILTGTLIAVISYYFNHKTIKQDIFENLLTVSNKLNKDVRNLIDEKRGLIYAFSSDSIVRECMEGISKRNESAHNYTGRLNTHLARNMQLIDPGIIEVFMIGLDGKVVSSTEINRIGQDVSGEIYFSRTMEMGSCISDLHYSPEFNQNTFEVSSLISVEETHKPTGIIVSRYSGAGLKKVTCSGMSEEFQELMQQNGLGETGETYIVNGNKLMITESRFIEDAVLKQVVDTEGVRVALDNRIGMFGIYPDYRGVPVMGVSRYFEEMGWVLLAEKDVSEAFVPIKRLRYYTVIVGIGGIMVIVAISVFLSGGITRPVRELVESAHAIAEGDLAKEIKVKSKDEIGALASSFDTMRIGLGRLLKNIEEAKHDWENTFDSISDLISIHDENFNIIRCNKAVIRKFNTQPKDLIGKKCYEVFHDINEPYPACPLVRSKETHKPETIEVEDPHMGGIFLISAFPRFDEQGRFIGCVQVARDITKQKEIEKREYILREISEKLSKTLDFETVSKTIFDYIGQIIPHDHTNVVSIDSKTQTVHFLAVKNKGELPYIIKRGRQEALKDVPVYLGYERKEIVYRPYEEIQKRLFQFDNILIEKEKIKRDVLIPLIQGGNVIGFLTLASRSIDTQFFDEDDRPFLKKIANVVVGTVSNALLLERIGESEEKYRRLTETITSVIYRADPESWEATFVNKAIEGIYGYTVDEWLKDPSLREKTIYPADRERTFASVMQSKKELKSSIIQYRILQKDKTVRWVEDHIDWEIDRQGKVVSLNGIMYDITGRRHYERTIAEESGINKILLEMAGAMLKTANVNELIEKSIAIISENLGYDYCSIILRAEVTNSFNAVEAIGKEESIVNMLRILRIKKPYIPLIERMMWSKIRCVVNIDDTDAKTREFMKEIQACSMLIVPLVCREIVTGFILYYHSPDNLTGLHKFSHKEEAVVEGIANQLSLGIENAKLYEELTGKSISLESRVEIMSVMREIDRTILSSLEPVHTYEVATQLVKRIIPCDRVTIVLIDKEAGGFRYTAGWGVELEKGAFVRFEDTNATEAVRTKRPVIRSNIAVEKNLLPLDKSFLEKGFLSDIRIPLIIKGDVYGLLNIGSRRYAGFTSEQIEIAKDIAAQITVAISNANLVTELKDLYFNTVKSLSEAIDAKSKWTRGHSDRVTDMAVSIGEELKLGQADIENLRLAATLHDIGKIGSCDDILDKPEALSKDEQKMMEEHPVRGSDIIKGIKQFKDVTPGVKHHHERFDGGGYPDGLKGGEIPLFARIIFVADSFDAMTSDRPYRKGLSKEKGIEEVRKGAGTQFAPEIVEAFLKINEAK